MGEEEYLLSALFCGAEDTAELQTEGAGAAGPAGGAADSEAAKGEGG